MTAGQQCDQQGIDNVLLADDDFAYLGSQPVHRCAKALHEFAGLVGRKIGARRVVGVAHAVTSSATNNGTLR